MREVAGTVARILSTTGLAGVSVLHAVWATGSPWPAKDEKTLAEAVIGSHGPMPGVAPTLVVAGGTAGAALLASGALGEGRVQRLGLRAIGTVMLMRALFGGNAAIAAMGLPPAGRTFRQLDSHFYRPLTALLGVSLWLSLRAPKR
ncbi:DUF3995 domain-containing protein [uncultured Plantibacter sp.]|uniref:DUF3995 domain-containing protein n=1 Tax=uncultured Plantibacter sp. TaxID=293337 RepID=UPI0028D456B8|nr:DUF3995 domain-containing protein [uncultured Plantibacter sp.]